MAAASDDTLSSTTISVIAGLTVGIALVIILSFVYTSTKNPSGAKSMFDFEEAQSVNLMMDIQDMPKVIKIGTALQPVIKIAGTVTGCTPPPYAEVRNTSTNQTVWDTGITTVFCDPEAMLRLVNIDWVLGKRYVENGIFHPRSNNSPMIAEKTGTYELTIKYAGLKESRTFDVVNSENQEKLILVSKNLSIVNSFLSHYSNSSTVSVLDHGSEISPEFAKFNPSAILQYSVERQQLYSQEGDRQLRLTVIFDANDKPSTTILECRGPVSTRLVNPNADLLMEVAEKCIQN